MNNRQWNEEDDKSLMKEKDNFLAWLQWTQKAVKESDNDELLVSLHNRVVADYPLPAHEVILTQLQVQELQFRGLLKGE